MTFDEWWAPKEKQIKNEIHTVVSELADEVKKGAKEIWDEIEKDQKKGSR